MNLKIYSINLHKLGFFGKDIQNLLVNVTNIFTKLFMKLYTKLFMKVFTKLLMKLFTKLFTKIFRQVSNFFQIILRLPFFTTFEFYEDVEYFTIPIRILNLLKFSSSYAILNFFTFFYKLHFFCISAHFWKSFSKLL